MKNTDFTQAQRDFLRGDYGRAIMGFGKALESGMDGGRVHLPLGLAYFRNRDFMEAVAEFSRVLKLRPNDDQVFFLRGMARFNAGDEAGAVSDLTAALDANPNRVAAYVGRSLANRSLGHDQAAERDLQQAVTQGGVEVELFLREYCLSPYLQHLGTTLFDTDKATWGRTVQVGRGTATTQ
jgi:Flp pilus assembly protein TadD